MNKILKTPKLTATSRLLSFDLETNGLHGQAFAVGAVVMDASGKVHDEFVARARLKTQVDPWVKRNVLPAIADLPVTYINYETMREAFWKWYLKAEPTADYVVVSNGYPVEYRFLLDCQEANLDERYWQHPFPLIDLSSLLLGKGVLEQSRKVVSRATADHNLTPHHPLHDAKITLLTAFAALQQP